MRVISKIRSKIAITISSLLSAISAGGSGASAVCQTTCSTTSGILPFVGLSFSATPFAFIEDYQKQIWQIAAVFLLVLFILYARNKAHPSLDRAFLHINLGLLLVGFPYLKEQFLIKLFPVAGIILVILGVILTIKIKNIKFIFT